jgi:Bacterial antitoxin of type II TA system, VapB
LIVTELFGWWGIAPHRNLRNRVFLSFCAVTNNFRKNPVSGHPHNLRNRGFLSFYNCSEVFSQKPGFWPARRNYNKRTVKRGKPMVTSLNVDTALLQEAIELTGETAIENLVEIALREYIQRLKQMKILEFFGTIDYEESCDYKQQRNIA